MFGMLGSGQHELTEASERFCMDASPIGQVHQVRVKPQKVSIRYAPLKDTDTEKTSLSQ